MDYRRFYSLINNQFNGEKLFDNDVKTKYTAGGGLVHKNFESYYEFPDEMNVMVNKLRLFDGDHRFIDRPITISIIRRANASQWTREYIGQFTGALSQAWQEIHLPVAKDIKYIIFSGAQWDNWPTELEVYGNYTPYTESIPSLPKQKFKNYFGVNVYEWNLLQDDIHPFVGWQVYEPKWDILKHYTHYRHYLDWDQIEGDEGKYSFQPTRKGAWFYDVFYERMSSGGRTITPCIKSVPGWLLETWPADQRHNENVPLKYPLSYDDVNSYVTIARTFFQFAARYGSTVVDPSLLNVYSPPGYAPQVKKSGLGYVKVMEAENERDKWWHGPKAYQNGRQYAAFLSAVYDGHMGALGPGVGIKAADPKMKMIMGGTANPLPDYARGIIDWCKQYRKDSLPFDSFTYHDYATNGTPLQFNADATRSVAPELSALGKNADNFLFTLGAFAKNKGKGLVNSEFGIDIDPTSPMKAIAIKDRSILQTHGDWTIRTALLYSRKRLERIYDFQFFDNIENSPGVFGTTGVANANLTKRPALDYVEQMTRVLGEYEYEQTLSNHPEVDLYKRGDSSRYVLWMGGETGSTSTYNFRLSNPANKVRIYELADGQSHMIQRYANVVSGVASVTVTETPKIIEEVPGDVPVYPPPTVNAGEDLTITLPVSEVSLTGTGFSEAGPVSYAWTIISGPVEYAKRIVAPYQAKTPVMYLSQGAYLFQLKVTDELGKSSADTVLVTVNNAVGNKAPEARAGGDVIITHPATSFKLDGSASWDPDGNIVKYRWKKVAGPSWGILTYVDASKMAVNYAEPGATYMFDLEVTDNKGAISIDRKVVTVLKKDQGAPKLNTSAKPPVANAGNDIRLATGNSTVLDGQHSKAADGYIIKQFFWLKISGPAEYSLQSPGLNATSVKNLQRGTYIFRLSVTDDKGASSFDDVTVVVLEAVAAESAVSSARAKVPVADAGEDQVVPPGQATVLKGDESFSPAGIITSYEWSKVSGPSEYEMLTPGFSNTWLRQLIPGTYVFRITITDDLGVTASDEVKITVTGAGSGNNILPVAKAGNDISVVLPTNSTTLNNAGSYDADGSISHYKWSYMIGPSSYDIIAPSAASTVVKNLVPGTYVFRLTVTDNSGATGFDEVTVNVGNTAGEFAPVANAGSDERIPVGQSTVLRGKKSYVPGGSIRSYAWSKISGPPAFYMLSPDSDTTWIREMTPGVYIYRLTVTSNTGKQASDEVAITVTAIEETALSRAATGLTAFAGTDETIPVGQSTLLNGEDSYVPLGTITDYTWTKISGPSQYYMLTPGEPRTWIREMIPGTYVYRLTVRDNRGAKAYDDVTITVTATSGNAQSGNSITEIPALSGSGNHESLLVVPNPVKSQAVLKWRADYFGPATIKVIDASDITVSVTNIKKEQPEYTGNLEVEALKPGVYIIEIKTQSGRSVTQKFIKY